MSDKIYIATKNEEDSWFIVAALTKNKDNLYHFYYTQGVLKFKNFLPFTGMENLKKEYISQELFPFFKNKTINKKRPEYLRLLQWLDLQEPNPDPIKILPYYGDAKTNSLEFIKRFPINKDTIEYTFFAHGLKKFAKKNFEFLEKLESGNHLKLLPDFNNKYDPYAVIIATKNETIPIAYCPRYISKYVSKLLKLENHEKFTLQVKKINQDAPLDYILLCHLEFKINKNTKETIQTSTNINEYEKYV